MWWMAAALAESPSDALVGAMEQALAADGVDQVVVGWAGFADLDLVEATLAQRPEIADFVTVIRLAGPGNPENQLHRWMSSHSVDAGVVVSGGTSTAIEGWVDDADGPDLAPLREPMDRPARRAEIVLSGLAGASVGPESLGGILGGRLERWTATSFGYGLEGGRFATSGYPRSSRRAYALARGAWSPGQFRVGVGAGGAFSSWTEQHQVCQQETVRILLWVDSYRSCETYTTSGDQLLPIGEISAAFGGYRRLISAGVRMQVDPTGVTGLFDVSVGVGLKREAASVGGAW